MKGRYEPRRLLPLGLALGLAGCGTSVLDPTLNPYTWQPEGVNDQNIAVQVARPADLVAPSGDITTGGAENVSALQRLRASAGQSLGGATGGVSTDGASTGGAPTGGGAGAGSVGAIADTSGGS